MFTSQISRNFAPDRLPCLARLSNEYSISQSLVATVDDAPYPLTNASVLHNIILVDTAHLDHVAFDLIVNFERMLGRQISQGDFPKWLDCVALDGGLRPGDHEIRVYLIHPKQQTKLQHFLPCDFAEELNGKAFRDELGEFALNAYGVEEIVSQEDYFVQVFEEVLRDADCERVMVIADLDGMTDESAHFAQRIKALCANPPKDDKGNEVPRKDITLFTMQPIMGRGFQQELLGYSLMAALGINGNEVQ